MFKEAPSFQELQAHYGRIERAKNFPDCAYIELDMRLTSRLGADNHRLVFEEPQQSPFGQKVCEMGMPHHMAEHAQKEDKPTHLRTGDKCLGFDYAGHTFIYDRLGLREEGQS